MTAYSVAICHIRYSSMPHVIEPPISQVFIPCESAGPGKMRSSIFTFWALNSFGMAGVKGLKIVRLLGDRRVRIEIIQHAQFAPSALRFPIGENGLADLVRVFRLVLVGMITRPD